MAKIIAVTANDDYTLSITLNNGHQIICDMQSKLQTLRFSSLADLKHFKAVRVEHANTLVWDSLCQITIDEILNMIEK
jgi:frataxin-like iron-binding protein CyaY